MFRAMRSALAARMYAAVQLSSQQQQMYVTCNTHKTLNIFFCKHFFSLHIKDLSVKKALAKELAFAVGRRPVAGVFVERAFAVVGGRLITCTHLRRNLRRRPAASERCDDDGGRVKKCANFYASTFLSSSSCFYFSAQSHERDEVERLFFCGGDVTERETGA
jgi:hypothetical protein